MRLAPSLAAMILAAAPALAQNPQATAPQNPVAPLAPPNAPTPPPEQIAPPSGGGTAGGTTGNLSNTLSRHRGTIAPPANIDPGMAVVPNGGAAATTPVIPPPGTPGGNQRVVPK